MAQTLKFPVYTELEIKKSRFLCWLEPLETPEQVRERLAQIRAQHPDARHVCFAFYVAKSSGMSDDGEPSGTAGRPMFNVLSHKDLENVLVVVVRYFGGIKLGAGGLSRAYGGVVSQAAEMAEFEVIEARHRLALQFPFALESQIRRVADQFALALDSIEYSDHVRACLTVSASDLEALTSALQAVDPSDPGLVVQPAD